MNFSLTKIRIRKHKFPKYSTDQAYWWLVGVSPSAQQSEQASKIFTIFTHHHLLKIHCQGYALLGLDFSTSTQPEFPQALNIKMPALSLAKCWVVGILATSSWLSNSCILLHARKATSSTQSTHHHLSSQLFQTRYLYWNTNPDAQLICMLKNSLFALKAGNLPTF